MNENYLPSSFESLTAVIATCCKFLCRHSFHHRVLNASSCSSSDHESKAMQQARDQSQAQQAMHRVQMQPKRLQVAYISSVSFSYLVETSLESSQIIERASRRFCGKILWVEATNERRAAETIRDDERVVMARVSKGGSVEDVEVEEYTS